MVSICAKTGLEISRTIALQRPQTIGVQSKHWEWSLDAQDFGREWYATVRERRFQTTICVQSTRVTPTTAANIVGAAHADAL